MEKIKYIIICTFYSSIVFKFYYQQHKIFSVRIVLFILHLLNYYYMKDILPVAGNAKIKAHSVSLRRKK